MQHKPPAALRKPARRSACLITTRSHPHTPSAETRHTFANDWLEGGGTEGDLMRLMGWKDRAMVDRYAADLQVQRAIQAKQRRGDIY